METIKLKDFLTENKLFVDDVHLSFLHKRVNIKLKRFKITILNPEIEGYPRKVLEGDSIINLLNYTVKRLNKCS